VLANPDTSRDPIGLAVVRKLYIVPKFFKPNISEVAANAIDQCAPYPKPIVIAIT
jgi:hypothetical protein